MFLNIILKYKLFTMCCRDHEARDIRIKKIRCFNLFFRSVKVTILSLYADYKITQEIVFISLYTDFVKTSSQCET